MKKPILCEGIACRHVYLPTYGGLVCARNHTPILMMSFCPAARWNRGYKVFDQKIGGVA